MSDRKGKEYANSEDRLANFKRLAVQLDLTPAHVLIVYAVKHMDSILRFIRVRGREETTESIETRIDDVQNFLDLLASMLLPDNINECFGITEENQTHTGGNDV